MRKLEEEARQIKKLRNYHPVSPASGEPALYSKGRRLPLSHGSPCDFDRLGAIALFRRPHLDLHEAILCTDALDANLRVGVRVYHAAKRISRIVVQGSVMRTLAHVGDSEQAIARYFRGC